MSKGTVYRCSECGYSCPKWLGRCPECGEWGTMDAQAAPVKSAKKATGGMGSGAVVGGLTPTSPARPLSDIGSEESRVFATGIGELDRVLGRGIVQGSVVLLAGEPGVGKSTLLLEVASRWAKAGSKRRCLYVTAEESAGQVRLRAERTGSVHPNVYLASESNLDVILGHVEEVKPNLLIVDSVQTVSTPGVEGVSGGVAQSRAVTAALTSLAKSKGIPVLLVGHVTKDGNVAGPRVLEHLVDVVLNFEGDRYSSLRMLRGIKNRFGATDEVGCFEQTATGIQEVPDPSGLFLSNRDSTPDGTAVTVAMDGVRPILAEIQSLVVTSAAKGNPRRAVTGLDSTRVPMVLAVLEARGGLTVSEKEVYIATVGGMRCKEPAVDLAVALATASACRGTALPDKTVVLGEVGLAGEIRRIPQLQQRLTEAARLGFKRAIVPANCLEDPIPGMQVKEVSDIKEALRLIKKAK
ncbi:MAG: DNA repair protein RadA [Corynebacterium sp.]|nr:DNA repair protein RadA [Corynebacterium sp.]